MRQGRDDRFFLPFTLFNVFHCSSVVPNLFSSLPTFDETDPLLLTGQDFVNDCTFAVSNKKALVAHNYEKDLFRGQSQKKGIHRHFQ